MQSLIKLVVKLLKCVATCLRPILRSNLATTTSEVPGPVPAGCGPHEIWIMSHNKGQEALVRMNEQEVFLINSK